MTPSDEQTGCKTRLLQVQSELQVASSCFLEGIHTYLKKEEAHHEIREYVVSTCSRYNYNYKAINLMILMIHSSIDSQVRNHAWIRRKKDELITDSHWVIFFESEEL